MSFHQANTFRGDARLLVGIQDRPFLAGSTWGIDRFAFTIA